MNGGRWHDPVFGPVYAPEAFIGLLECKSSGELVIQRAHE
jgi:hypothetical protein